MKYLYEVPLHQSVYIRSVDPASSMKRRLLDLGFVKGSRIRVLRESLSGGMRVYLVNGCRIALRKCDARYIEIREEEEQSV